MHMRILPPPWPLSLSNSASAVIAINTRRTRASHVPRPSLSATYRLGPSRQKQAQGCSLQVHMAGCGVGPGVVGPWLGQREVQTGPDQARWGGGEGVGTTYRPLTYIRRHLFFWKGGREKTYSKSLKFCAKSLGNQTFVGSGPCTVQYNTVTMTAGATIATTTRSSSPPNPHQQTTRYC